MKMVYCFQVMVLLVGIPVLCSQEGEARPLPLHYSPDKKRNHETYVKKQKFHKNTRYNNKIQPAKRSQANKSQEAQQCGKKSK